VLSPRLQQVLDQAPRFDGYRVGRGTALEGRLTSQRIRPANLFFNALLGPNATTIPGSGTLFAFTQSQAAIRDQILQANPDALVSVRAEPELQGLYGNRIFRVSYGEIQSTLQSQTIYTSIPLAFYKALKAVLLADGYVTLPTGPNGEALRLDQVTSANCKRLFLEVTSHPNRFGLRILPNFTLYQMGSLVVKREDYRLLTDRNGQIRERMPGEQDAIRLINGCGIRDLRRAGGNSAQNRDILTEGFGAVLAAAEKGFLVMPAVGMGIWGGDPNLYWRALLDAIVLFGKPLENILINPRHQPTPSGIYCGQNGAEFQTILNEYLKRFAGRPERLANLKKIVNLYDRQTDILRLSHELKVAFPNQIVSLFNASDPDVTLGNHVGEYVNNLDHPDTTEENYTALGTNGLCFEGITGVLHDPARLIQTMPF